MSLQIVRTCSSKVRATDLIVRYWWYLFCGCAAHECVTHELLKQFALLGRHVCDLGIGLTIEFAAIVGHVAICGVCRLVVRAPWCSKGRVQVEVCGLG